MSTVKNQRKWIRLKLFGVRTEKDSSKETYGCEIVIENGKPR